MFDLGVFRGHSFDVPVIAVGNLRVGGTGKTPAIIALLAMVPSKFHLAVLSRGYGRSTNGWFEVATDSEADQTGDEPVLIKQSHPDADVAVMENRVKGIERLLGKDPKPEVVLLDDAMQHRWVKPGHLILLTAYHQRYSSDYLLPMGRLREHRSAAARADTILVTKCPLGLSPSERRMIKDELGPKEHQEVCFSYEEYPGLVELSTGNQVEWKTFTADQALLVTGIADPSTLLLFLEDKVQSLEHIAFRDHQDFTESDMERILSQFRMMQGETTLVLTTEKDAQRIAKWMQNEKFASLPVYVVLHRMQWFEKDREIIEKRLNGFIKAYSGNDSLH